MTLQADDRKTLDLLKAGDIAAFRLLFESWYPVLFPFANLRIHDTEASKDIIQDVFTYVWEKRASLDIHTSIKTYLFGAVHHACLNYLKKHGSHWEKTRLPWDDQYPGLQQDMPAENGYDAVFLHETEDRLQEIINNLPAECKKVFMLSRFNGMKSRAIADFLSLSPRTVETQIYRALQVLKDNFYPS
jgi:RNA polymerase sigma-70 factor, ECF subfamily